MLVLALNLQPLHPPRKSGGEGEEAEISSPQNTCWFPQQPAPILRCFPKPLINITKDTLITSPTEEIPRLWGAVSRELWTKTKCL